MNSAGPKTTATEAIRLESNSKLATQMENHLLDEWTCSVMRVVLVKLQKHLQPDDVERSAGVSAPEAVHITQQMLDAKVDLELQLTSTMPLDEERMKLEADKMLLAFGRLYLPEYARAYKLPNGEMLGAGVLKMEAEAAQAQAQMDAQGGGK